MKNLFEMVDWTQRVVFFDGVTSAYLSAAATRRVLMLHADHRSPEGPIVPRSRYLIENFQGEAILTSTQVHKRRLEEDVTPGAPIHVIPHYCETEGGTDGGTGGARRDLVTVSRLELTGKPIHQCIEAFCRIMGEFQDVDYVIYGLGAGQAALEALIAELGCGDRVTLAGYTTAPLEVFRGAIASVYPTMTEGFGLSILEALASGCPVITYDVDYGPREMITPGQNGELVAPGDIDGLAQAMRAVLSASDAYQQRSAMGLERYGRDAFVRNYAQLIEALAAPTCADG